LGNVDDNTRTPHVCVCIIGFSSLYYNLFIVLALLAASVCLYYCLSVLLSVLSHHRLSQYFIFLTRMYSLYHLSFIGIVLSRLIETFLLADSSHLFCKTDSSSDFYFKLFDCPFVKSRYSQGSVSK
jgi:hypothetical protein